MSKVSFILPGAVALLFAACSSTPQRKTLVYQVGDRAPVDRMAYVVLDSQILPRIGDEATGRMPQNRFYVIQISATNSGSDESTIPAMTLVADSGKTYEELTDGTGIPHWFGVVRRLGANQSETGTIVFDAPAAHYRLKLTDDTDADDVFVELPLSFAHEQLDLGEGTAPPAPEPPAPKIKPVPKKQ